MPAEIGATYWEFDQWQAEAQEHTEKAVKSIALELAGAGKHKKIGAYKLVKRLGRLAPAFQNVHGKSLAQQLVPQGASLASGAGAAAGAAGAAGRRPDGGMI